MYKHFIKPLMDFILSLIASFILVLPIIIISIAIVIDDPGPVLFKQTRVGKSKKGEISYFSLYKFRTMKTSAPHDQPTHLLSNPNQYITRVGKFLRKMSLDEIVQIPLNILTGKMSIIGPRPALWNQGDLVAEREKYGANDVKPGLTGWAQINGRDELSIEHKAKLDGEYVNKLNAGWFRGVVMDMKCFFGTFLPVLKADGIVEGDTKESNKSQEDNIAQLEDNEKEIAKEIKEGDL